MTDDLIDPVLLQEDADSPSSLFGPSPGGSDKERSPSYKSIFGDSPPLYQNGFSPDGAVTPGSLKANCISPVAPLDGLDQETAPNKETASSGSPKSVVRKDGLPLSPPSSPPQEKRWEQQPQQQQTENYGYSEQHQTQSQQAEPMTSALPLPLPLPNPGYNAATQNLTPGTKSLLPLPDLADQGDWSGYNPSFTELLQDDNDYQPNESFQSTEEEANSFQEQIPTIYPDPEDPNAPFPVPICGEGYEIVWPDGVVPHVDESYVDEPQQLPNNNTLGNIYGNDHNQNRFSPNPQPYLSPPQPYQYEQQLYSYQQGHLGLPDPQQQYPQEQQFAVLPPDHPHMTTYPGSRAASPTPSRARTPIARRSPSRPRSRLSSRRQRQQQQQQQQQPTPSRTPSRRGSPMPPTVDESSITVELEDDEPTTPTHHHAPSSTGNERRIDNSRSGKEDPANDPQNFYQPSPIPAAWGPLTSKAGKRGAPRPLFEYHKRGPELAPGDKFNPRQIAHFIRGEGHPAPPGERQLTLWIQNVPAQLNNRYLSGSTSQKCRWDECPAPQGTILKGFFRVAFDEYADRTAVETDPYHMACYMHLYCFEEAFDLGYLYWRSMESSPSSRVDFSIRPDVRDFPKEDRNAMSLNRDKHADLLDVFEDWAEDQYPRYCQINDAKKRDQNFVYDGFQPQSYPVPDHERLYYQLTKNHVETEVDARERTREKRGGAHIAKHMGNLDKYHSTKKALVGDDRPAKRKYGEDEDEAEEQAYQQAYFQPAPAPSRNKRARTKSVTVAPVVTSPVRRSTRLQRATPATATNSNTRREEDDEFVPNSDWLNQQPSQEQNSTHIDLTTMPSPKALIQVQAETRSSGLRSSPRLRRKPGLMAEMNKKSQTWVSTGKGCV